MRFLIKFTVEEEAVGPVLAALNSHDGVVFDHLAIEPLGAIKKPPSAPPPGFTRVSKAQTPPPLYKKRRKASAGKAVNAQDHVLQFLLDGKPHRYKDVQTMLKGLGFSAVGSTLRHLEKKGLAEKCEGGWQLVQLLPYDKVLPPQLVKGV